MDKRTFLALLALATATDSPTLAQQVRYAEATGDMRHISAAALLRAVYNLSLTGDRGKIGRNALIRLGYNRAEAALITETAKSIARKAGSYETFCGVLDGRAPRGVTLSAQEAALIRSVGRSSTGSILEGKTLATGGRTWEGTGGRTWEGTGGRTWEGSLSTGIASAVVQFSASPIASFSASASSNLAASPTATIIASTATRLGSYHSLSIPASAVAGFSASPAALIAASFTAAISGRASAVASLLTHPSSRFASPSVDIRGNVPIR